MECKLQIVDEVNVRLIGLPPAVRRQIANTLKFEVSYARHTPQYKLGRWDGTRSFFGVSGFGYLNHLETILSIIQSHGITVSDIEDNRDPFVFTIPKITESYWADKGKCWPDGHPMAGELIYLRDYQVEGVNNFLDSPQGLQSMATGAGKCLSGDSKINLYRLDGGGKSYQSTSTMLELANLVESEFGPLEHEVAIDISSLTIFVDTPSGMPAPVQYFVKKCDLETITVKLANGSSFTGATKHIVQNMYGDVFLEDLKVGDKIKHRDGYVFIIGIENAPVQDCYDITIPAPHLYYDVGGVIHHNTIITATLSALCEEYGRTMVIVPNKGLVVQTEEDYKNVGLDVGVYYGDRKELNKTHTIVTWQSLNVLDKKGDSLEALTLMEFIAGVKCVIVDEAHMATGEVLLKLLTGAFARTPIRWGLTGTVPKDDSDFHCILSSLGDVVNKITAKDLQDSGYLSNCNVNIIQTFETKAFRSYPEELKYLVTDSARLQGIAKLCNNIKDSGNTLILVDRIACGNMLNELIPNSVFISGEVKLKDRKEHYDDVKLLDDKVIIATYGVAAVGLNIPRIFNLVLIEPGKSFVRVIQSIGRGLRKAADKDYVEIYDITASTKYAKAHLAKRKTYYREAQYPFTVTKVDLSKE